MGAWELTTWPAVVPVLVGPLQTLLALLPALLVGLGAFCLALFTPRGFRRALRFFWRQKLFTLMLLAVVASLVTGWPWHRMIRGSRAALGLEPMSADTWPMFRGDPQRSGHGVNDIDPMLGIAVWNYQSDATVLSSPAVVGDLVLFSTAFDISPFNPAGRGAIVAVDAVTGFERWRYAPDDFRATFSSPVAAEGFVVCGEGLHQVQDARVTCLDMNGQLQWEFRTASHVEATPTIADGRVYVGAGDDGFYCLNLRGDGQGHPQVMWHLSNAQFPDCESSAIVIDGMVYFGLGDRGQSVCAVDAQSGELQWCIATPYPVFASPTWIPPGESTGPKLIVAMGNGNFVQSADELRERKLAELQARGATAPAIAEATRKLAPGGQVWCIDVASQEVDWRYLTGETVLGSVAVRGDRMYFGCRDGTVHCVSPKGQTLRRTDLRDPIVASPAIGRNQVYFATSGGRLFALDAQTLGAIWDAPLGAGENFTSSPLVSHGHVYVGTQQEGLTCLGTTGQIGSAWWGRGTEGGAADFDPLPVKGRVEGQWPAGNETFETTWPLTIADGRLIAIRRTADDPLMVCLDFKSGGHETPRAVWQLPCAPFQQLQPLAVDGQIITVENFSALGRPASVHDEAMQALASWPHILARRSDDGVIQWRIPLPSTKTLRWICDLQYIYLLAPNGAMAFSARNGTPKWGTTYPENYRVTVALADDILMFGDGAAWTAMDAGTGITLWKAAADGQEIRLLDANASHFLSSVTREDSPPLLLQWRQVLNGALVWQMPWDAQSPPEWARLSAEHVMIVDHAGGWQARRLSDGSRVQFEPPAPDVAGESAASWSPRTGLLRPYPLIARTRIIDPYSQDALRVFDLDDRSIQVWLPLADTGRPVSQMLAAQGRIFFLSDRGRIVCVGTEGSP